MKKILSISLISVFCIVFSQDKIAVDTAQVVVANRTNSAEALQKPYLILISADGFRYDYAQKYHAENLLKFSGTGVAAEAMMPSFPSITFPNHWSIITGLYPSHHGLVDNFFYDYSRKEFYAMSKTENAEDGSWYGGIPLWSLAEKQGVLSATMHWVGSASDAGGTRPTYYYHYHDKFSPADKVTKVVNWLKLPAEVRPHFITLYFPEVDAAGHHYGPDAKETENAVQMIDKAMGDLVEKVNKLGLKNVNFIFVSDHGMIKIDKKNTLQIPKMLSDKSRFDIFNSQTLLRVVVKSGNENEIQEFYRQLKNSKTENYDVILARKFPEKLHYSSQDDKYHRIGQILLKPKAPYIFLEKGKETSIGKHGYDPRETEEMRAVFYAWGDAFKTKKVISPFSNVDIYPLAAKILGLKITEPIDGKASVLHSILK